jgi:hypothetical protein
MPKAYSLDLRERVACFVGFGPVAARCRGPFQSVSFFRRESHEGLSYDRKPQPKPGGGGDMLSSIRIGRFCWPESLEGAGHPILLGWRERRPRGPSRRTEQRGGLRQARRRSPSMG